MGWEKIVPFPERKPLLGWYDEGSPEVADWEIKWCVEHGISFFVYCWYRYGEGSPVQSYLSHAIHDGLFNAKYRNVFHFAVMWENANGRGISSKKDLLDNLLPYWMETYFKLPIYLKIDDKPTLFIYNVNRLSKELGGIDSIRSVFDTMRIIAKKQGYSGLLIFCEYRGEDTSVLRDIKKCGFDDIFAYGNTMGKNDPSPAEAMQFQLDHMNKLKSFGIIHFIPTISMGWDPKPWQPNDIQKWQIPPADFKILCQQTKTVMSKLPMQSLGNKMLLIDNWNEWGEGHYIAPCEQYGFGYLDAVRETFTNAPKKHRDLTPADIGRGPYDSLFNGTRQVKNP